MAREKQRKKKNLHFELELNIPSTLKVGGKFLSWGGPTISSIDNNSRASSADEIITGSSISELAVEAKAIKLRKQAKSSVPYCKP